jgi:hypothetical protein
MIPFDESKIISTDSCYGDASTYFWPPMFFRFVTFFLALLPISVFAQSGVLSGIVRDVEGHPAVGIFITQKDNVNNGTQTNENGKFSLTIPAGKSVIVVFKGIGADPIEKSIHLVRWRKTQCGPRLRECS